MLENTALGMRTCRLVLLYPIVLGCNYNYYSLHYYLLALTLYLFSISEMSLDMKLNQWEQNPMDEFIYPSLQYQEVIADGSKT